MNTPEETKQHEEEENMTAQEKLAQAIREERGEMTVQRFSKRINVSNSAIADWEQGKRVPEEKTINQLAGILGWNDKKRMSFMPEPEEKGLMKRVMRHRQYLKLNQVEFAKYMGVAYTTVQAWRKGGHVSEDKRAELVKFLRASEEDVYHVMRHLEWEGAVKEMKKRRVKIPYDAIQKLECRERGFGRMSDVPDDHPELLKLQRHMNAKW